MMLLAGMIGACTIYWMGTRSPNLKDHQMAQLYGNMGLMIDNLLNDLKRPGTQAKMIAGISALVASGCFRFAREPDRGDKAG